MSAQPWRNTPEALQDDPTMPPGAVRLWAVLDNLARTAHAVEATGTGVCAAAGCSPRALRLWRSRLVAAGWLRHEGTDGGRGVPSLWWPLRRVRRGITGGVVPVDNSGTRHRTRHETRHSRAASDLGNPAEPCRVSAAVEKGSRVTETEARDDVVIDVRDGAGHRLDADTRAALAARPSSWPSWCGHCHPRNSLTDSLLTPGLATRCPACHPTRPVPAF